MGDLRAIRESQDITLKWWFAWVGLALMVVELCIATIVFWRYANAKRWDIPDGVISAYLGSTVVQVVGLVIVMARSLFPPVPQEQSHARSDP